MGQATNTMAGVKTRIDGSICPSYTDNKVRANHHWAMQTLGHVEQVSCDLGDVEQMSCDLGDVE